MIIEGTDLILNCSVKHGTVPITFTWYRKGLTKPLNKTQNYKTQGFHIIYSITRNDEGDYYCQAHNDANDTEDSAFVTIKGPTSLTFCYYLLLFVCS